MTVEPTGSICGQTRQGKCMIIGTRTHQNECLIIKMIDACCSHSVFPLNSVVIKCHNATLSNALQTTRSAHLKSSETTGSDVLLLITVLGNFGLFCFIASA